MFNNFKNRFATIPQTSNKYDKHTFVKHKEVEMICEENGLVITNYNVLITQPKSKPIAQPIVNYTTIKH
jgi:hypothetical protein